jgi:type I restriction enzyme S subunit
VKAGWTTATLSEVCEFQRGLTYAKSDEVDTSRNVVLRANNIDLVTNRLDLTDLRFISDAVVIPAIKRVRRDSLLVCTASGSKAHLGKVAFIDTDYDFAFGGFMGQLTPGEQVLPKFLFYMMISEAYKDFIASLSDGANINNLKFTDLGRFRIPIPPLPEQRRIVALLDEAFAGLATAAANAERNLDNARELFESHLAEVFSRRGDGWVETTLGGVAVIDWGNTDLTKAAYVPNGAFLAVSAAGCDGRIDTKEHKRHTPVLSAIGAQCGRVFLPEEDFTAIKNTMTLTPMADCCDGRFLFHLLSSTSLPRRGAAQPFLAKGDVCNHRVSIPACIDDQRCIAARLNALASETQRLAAIHEQKQAALAALKRSLLHRAFNGEL